MVQTGQESHKLSPVAGVHGCQLQKGLCRGWFHRGTAPLSPSPAESRASNNDSASLDERVIPISPCHRHVMPSAISSTDAHLLLAPAVGANRASWASTNSSSQTQLSAWLKTTAGSTSHDDPRRKVSNVPSNAASQLVSAVHYVRRYGTRNQQRVLRSRLVRPSQVAVEGSVEALDEARDVPG